MELMEMSMSEDWFFPSWIERKNNSFPTASAKKRNLPSKTEEKNGNGCKKSKFLENKKGKDDVQDIMLAFFFDKIEDAEKFANNNDYENLLFLQRFGQLTIGKYLAEKAKAGTHINVVYVGTELSFNVCFK